MRIGALPHCFCGSAGYRGYDPKAFPFVDGEAGRCNATYLGKDASDTLEYLVVHLTGRILGNADLFKVSYESGT